MEELFFVDLLDVFGIETIMLFYLGKMGDSPRSIIASPATSEVSGKKSRKLQLSPYLIRITYVYIVLGITRARQPDCST